MGTQVQWRIRTAAALAAVGVFSAAFPLYVNNPFHVQGGRELAAGLWLARYQQWIAGATAGLALLAVVKLPWRRRSAWTAVAVSLVALVATQVDVYSLVFHRMEQPEFVEIARAELAEDAPVLAVVIKGEGKAYPVAVVAYHHVVNDRLGGAAIAATW